MNNLCPYCRNVEAKIIKNGEKETIQENCNDTFNNSPRQSDVYKQMSIQSILNYLYSDHFALLERKQKRKEKLAKDIERDGVVILALYERLKRPEAFND